MSNQIGSEPPGSTVRLSLATVFGIVKQNNGFIKVYSGPGHGTTFRIYLPGQGPEMAAPSPAPTALAVPGSGTILLVEDESAIRQVIVQMLQRLGYTVVTASGPAEAIRLARNHAGTLDAVVTDVVMLEMTGRDLAKNLISIHPNMKARFMSVYTASDAITFAASPI